MISFDLFGCKITVSLFFSAIITFMLLTDSTGTVPFMLLGVLCHELGHFIAIKICSVKMAQINLTPFCIDVVVGNKGSLLNQLFIASSGIISNMLLFLFGVFFYRSFQIQWIPAFCFPQLFIGLYNLFPIKGLDGNEILTCILCFFALSENGIFKITRFISFFFIIVLSLSAILVLLYFKNPFLLLFCIYLFVMG